ncbi:MAG: hypothetical protein HZB99_03005 [Candidatus Harrisonbacteria bacterium]|nr:hypothetical protein [Candidatus Harrisonbacteria bacterium]
MSLVGKFRELIQGLFKKRVSAEEFERCVFLAITKRVVAKEAVQGELGEIDSLLRAPAGFEDRTKIAARLYLRLEKYIGEEQPKNRISRETLREMIFNSCHGEAAEGDLALIFLPQYLRRVRLMEKLSEALIDKSRHFIGEERYVNLLNSLPQELNGSVKNGKIDWLVFEQKVRQSAAEPEKQEEFASQTLSKLLSGLVHGLLEAIEAARSELLFREVYQQFRDNLNFVENVPQVLRIVPDGILEEEKLEILEKPKLVDELRKRNQELEFAMAQLSEEKKKLEQEQKKLAVALDDLKAVDRAKSEFIDVVSHQFRTPLSAARWNSEIIGDELANVAPEELKIKLAEYNRLIQEKIVFIINILEDVYDVLAIEGKTLAIEKKPSQLWEIVADVLKEQEKEAERERVSVIFDRSKAPLKEVLLDPTKIHRICKILIRNAIHYTPEKGKVIVSIWEGESEGKPVLVFSVKDTGIGVAQEDMPKLFTKFFRAKNAVKKIADGAGLGLYLVKRFIEAHGGAIWVESELDKGSTFTFAVPES